MELTFPPAIDSTLIASFRSCGQKANLESFQHWKTSEPSVHLHAGAAFAKGLEETYKAFFEHGLSSDLAIGEGLAALSQHYGDFEHPEGSAKSLSRMLGALEFYFDTWPLGVDKVVPARIGGRLNTEFLFAEPLPILHPETGDPLIYCGRSDMLANFAGGVWIKDDKTASQLGASWGNQWDLRSQFTGYCWAALQSGIPVQGCIIRGVSILKTMYGSAEHITYRPQWMIDRWFKQVLRDVTRLIECWRTNEWDFNLDHACSEYGGCPFKGVCMLPDPTDWLATYYQKRRWDPITRTETLLAA